MKDKVLSYFFTKKVLYLFLACVLFFHGSLENVFAQNNVYTGMGRGHKSDIVVDVTVNPDENNKIVDIEVKSHDETPSYFENAKAIIPKIIAQNSTEVDAITNATRSSNGIKFAVENALSKIDLSKIYINGHDGDDGNDGSEASPVKTFAKAKELLVNGGVLIVQNTIVIKDEQNWSSESDKMIVLKRSGNWMEHLVEIAENGSLTLNHIILDGGAKEGISAENSLVQVKNGGTLILEDGAILQNNKTSASGAGVDCSGIFNMIGGKITGNEILSKSGSGAGVRCTSHGVFTMSGGEITNNKSAGTGGGVSVEKNRPPMGSVAAKFIMNGGSIKHNQSENHGAGVCLWFGNFEMTGGNIHHNSSSQDGGGIHGWFANIKLYGGSIAENIANKSAGIYVLNGNVDIKGDVIVKGNTRISGEDDNVNALLQISGQMGENAEVFVSGQDGQVFAESIGGYRIFPVDAQKFKSDDSQLEVKLMEEDKLALSVKSADTLYEQVYLNGKTGDNSNAGNSEDAAVKTFAKAKSLLAPNGTIFITDMVVITGQENWNLSDKQNAKVQRHSSYIGQEPGEENHHQYVNGPLIEVNGEHASLELSDIILDGNKTQVTSVAGLIAVKKGELSINQGAILQNQSTDKHNGAGLFIFKDANVVLNGGIIRDNHTFGYGGGVFNGGNFIFVDGQVINNSAEVRGGGILNNATMKMRGNAIVKDNELIVSSNQTPSNLVMAKGKEVVILSKLGDHAHIGIDSYVKPANVVKGSKHPNPKLSHLNYIISDADLEKFKLDDSEHYKLSLLNNVISIKPKAEMVENAIYLNPKAGSDDKDGRSVEKSVKSISNAMELAKQNSFDKIYLLDSIVVEDEQNIDFQGLQLHRHVDFLDEMIKVSKNGVLSLSNVVLDGGKTVGIIASRSLISVEKEESDPDLKGKLKLLSGVTLQNNSSLIGGGAIRNSGVVELYEGTEIKGCDTQKGHDGGGGIFNSPNANLVIFGGMIEKNSAFAGAGIENEGHLVIKGGHIRNNVSRGGGAGIHMFAEGRNASLLMEGGIISDNESTENSGGAIFVWQGNITVTGGVIKKNKAKEIGGICLRGQNSSMKLGGSPQIYDNISASNQLSNLVHESLFEPKESSIIQISKFEEGAKIGISSVGKVVKAQAGYEISDSDVKKYFSDKNLRVYRKENAIFMDSSKDPNTNNDSSNSRHIWEDSKSESDSGSFDTSKKEDMKKKSKEDKSTKANENVLENQKLSKLEKMKALNVLQDNATKFEDIEDRRWYTSAINYVYEKGIMKGIEEKSFSPNAEVTRDMLISMIYRMADSPKVESQVKFKDIESGSYYEDAVKWGVSNKIIRGYHELTFGSKDVVTREQIAVILMNFAISQGVDVSSNADMSKFEDFSQSSDYSKRALKWAYFVGIINGTSQNTLDPKSGATRAQIAVMIQRYMVLVK